MTAAISVAKHEGAEAWPARRPATVGVDGGLRRQGRAEAAGADPRGQDRRRQMAQAVVHGAEIIMVRGNFDHCLDIASGWRRTTRSRWSTRSTRCASRARRRRPSRSRLPRRRSRLPPASGRQRRQHRRLLDGLPAVRRTRPRHELPVTRFPGRGCGAAGDRRAVPDPETKATAIGVGNSVSAAPGRDGRPGSSEGQSGVLQRMPRSLAGQAEPARRACTFRQLRCCWARLGRRAELVAA